MDQRERLLELIQCLYAAPGSVEGWQQFLQQLTAQLAATGAAFLAHDLAAQTSTVFIKAGFDAETEDAYNGYWATHDPWAHNPVIPTLHSGIVVSGEQLAPHDVVKRTAYYNDFGRTHGIARCIAGMIEMDHRRFSCVTLNATEQRGPFGPDDRTLLERLMPHLQRALQVHRRLGNAETLAGASAGALDHLAHGVLLVDSSGRVVFANRTAEEILRAGDGLTIEGGELFGARAADTTTLRALIAEVVAASAGEGVGSGGLTLLGRPSGRPPLRVLVAALPARQILFGPVSVAACIFITDPERSVIPRPEHLRVAFGLTSAETRVAMAMMDGESLDRLADRLCISRNTARTHLQRLFAKTGTSRQADLVRVLLSAQPPIRLDGMAP